jgi:DNA-binding MarR family transcriptional regulator
MTDAAQDDGADAAGNGGSGDTDSRDQDGRFACSDGDAWRTFLRAHALVSRRIEADLMAAHGLTLVSFDVLEHLADAPEQRLRMADLADLLVVSRSGVTRAVDRLVRAGLVRRAPCTSDLRGTYAEITPEGQRRLLEAVPTHQAGVSFYVTDPMGRDGVAALTTLLTPVVERLEDA